MLYLSAQPLALGLFFHVRLLRGTVTLYVTALTAAMNKTVVRFKMLVRLKVHTAGNRPSTGVSTRFIESLHFINCLLLSHLHTKVTMEKGLRVTLRTRECVDGLTSPSVQHTAGGDIRGATSCPAVGRPLTIQLA